MRKTEPIQLYQIFNNGEKLKKKNPKMYFSLFSSSLKPNSTNLMLKTGTRALQTGAIYAHGVPFLGNEMINEQDFVSNFVSNTHNTD